MVYTLHNKEYIPYLFIVSFNIISPHLFCSGLLFLSRQHVLQIIEFGNILQISVLSPFNKYYASSFTVKSIKGMSCQDAPN